MSRKVKKRRSNSMKIKKVKKKLKWTEDMKLRREKFGSLLGF